jgi:uncharacterized membrane protein SirB2
MIEFYPEVRLTHIAAVLASGAMFVLRGLGVFTGARWPFSWPARVAGYTIDTVLLTAALLLITMVQQYPYIVLGYIAFWGGQSRSRRIGYWIAGMAVFGFIVTVARQRDASGFFALMMG